MRKVEPDGTLARGCVGRRLYRDSITEAPSLDKATKLVRGRSAIRGGAEIAVYETLDAM